jgi:hypothetical protein
MMMFCAKCGAAAKEGSKFCLNCGSPLSAESSAPPTYTPPVVTQQADLEERGRKKGGGFFSSGAGIALVIILGVAVLAGITFGIIFLVKGDANNQVDAATVDVWEEYESILEDNSTDLAQINMDPNALTKDQEELKKAQERVAALEKVLAKTGGTEERRNNNNNNNDNIQADNTRDIKAAQMAAALAAYNEYVKKMDEFLGALIGAIVNNQLFVTEVVNNLNAMLADLQKLATEVTNLSNKFLKDNEQVTVAKFNPPVLLFAKDITPQVEQKTAEAQAAEAARIEAERVAAEQAAAAEAARQAAEAEAARQRAEEESTQTTDTTDTTDDWTCGDPNCPI